ncbi:GTP-binding protein 10,GTP-binding protein 10 homolog,GTPase Obg,GTPase Obg/CgtA [Mytilus edulis]|uniref:GTP-binding protein 10,GTP-binding protein 10 homolog,GTPase Obg,GTPase Obg/CgtA n=1 Tax=Mytilus edulis TaxID=6550 RepID=A0A8S3TMM6_MYTED|nr:GTP-binding protein 10,GTP-binding protein 10 homolog,GTPase Obg,GTPase Obg/CgtA [Mytilus edulis]
MFITLRIAFCRSYCTRAAAQNIIKKESREFKKRFFDTLRLYVKGGSGGQGYSKYGGVGGKGGDVTLRCVGASSHLTKVKDKYPEKRCLAQTGKNSGKRHLLGDNGENLTIEVPAGIIVRNDEGREIADLNKEGQEFVVAKGGIGGHPGNNFLGKAGDLKSITHVLKLIADIGLVGFPNAGKSTFLSAISRANPKVASYPFTTLKPQIGMMVYNDHRQITVADLPGLIEGAHVNYGLGHKFLRHIERTKLLLFMVDLFGFQLKPHTTLHRTAFETIILLNKELELYKEELLDKPAVLALNKIDCDPEGKAAEEVLQKLKNLPESLSEIPEELRPQRLVKFDEIFVISAQDHKGTDNMKLKLRQLLDVYADQGNTELALQMKETSHIIEKSKEHSKWKLV